MFRTSMQKMKQSIIGLLLIGFGAFPTAALAATYNFDFKIDTSKFFSSPFIRPKTSPTPKPSPTVAPAQTPTPLPSASFNNTYYILPIIDNPASPDKVNSIFNSLTRGGKYVKTGFAGVYRFMQQVDANNDYKIKTDDLQVIFDTAVATNSPFIININGGQWAQGGPLIDWLMSDPNKVMWNQNNQPWQKLEDGQYHLSWSKYNTVHRQYRKRNLQDTVKFINNFRNGPNGKLLLAVSLDSEISMGDQPYFDYNPMMIREWNEKYPGLAAPKSPSEANWDKWTSFRKEVIDRTVQETADWVVQAGFPSDLVFPHQIPDVRPDVFCSSIDSGIANGIGGITTYADKASDLNLFSYMRRRTSDWGIFEYNPLSGDYNQNFNAVKATWDNKAHFITPYIWASNNPEFDAIYIIQGRPFEQALKDFINQYQNKRR